MCVTEAVHPKARTKKTHSILSVTNSKMKPCERLKHVQEEDNVINMSCGNKWSGSKRIYDEVRIR
jgi:hypothetical protein